MDVFYKASLRRLKRRSSRLSFRINTRRLLDQKLDVLWTFLRRPAANWVCNSPNMLKRILIVHISELYFSFIEKYFQQLSEHFSNSFSLAFYRLYFKQEVRV